MRYVLIAGAMIFAAPLAAQTAPAPTATPAAPAATPQFSVDDTDIGTLLDNPATKAVLDKNIPGFSTNPQIDMARPMTLRQVQQYAPDRMPDAMLTKVDADLKALPAAK